MLFSVINAILSNDLIPLLVIASFEAGVVNLIQYNTYLIDFSYVIFGFNTICTPQRYKINRGRREAELLLVIRVCFHLVVVPYLVILPNSLLLSIVKGTNMFFFLILKFHSQSMII